MRRRVVLAALAMAPIAVACNALLGVDDLPLGADAGADGSADVTIGVVDAAIDRTTASDASPGDAPPIESGDDAPTDPLLDANADAGCIFPCTIGDPLCGCGAGSRCDFDYLGEKGNNCVPLGVASEGEDCNGAFCAEGLTCYHDVCRHYCDGPDGGCAGAYPSVCVALPNTPFHACAFACRPDDPLACVHGEAGVQNGCVYDYATQLTDCQRVGSSTLACKGKGCAPSYACAADGGGCEKVCRVDGGACASPTRCLPPSAYPSAPWGTCR